MKIKCIQMLHENKMVGNAKMKMKCIQMLDENKMYTNAKRNENGWKC